MKANDKDLDEAELHQLLEQARSKDTKSVAMMDMMDMRDMCPMMSEQRMW